MIFIVTSNVFQQKKETAKQERKHALEVDRDGETEREKFLYSLEKRK